MKTRLDNPPVAGDKYQERLYGNTGTPITMDMGGFRIQYREPILGGNRVTFHKTSTMMQAVAEFNSIESLSMSEGKPFETPLSIERIGIDGQVTDRWTMDGRYSIPRHVLQVRNGRYDVPRRNRNGN